MRKRLFEFAPGSIVRHPIYGVVEVIGPAPREPTKVEVLVAGARTVYAFGAGLVTPNEDPDEEEW